MLKNYFKLTLRHLRKYRTYSFITHRSLIFCAFLELTIGFGRGHMIEGFGNVHQV